MLDEFTHLTRLQAVIEAGSMRSAAEKLSVTQPALTRSIAILEARFGRALLERHSRGVRPTPFGQKVLASTQRLARHWQVVDADLRTLQRSEARTLRIAAGPMWRVLVLPKVLGKLHERFPDLTIELANATRNEETRRLMTGEVDVVFGGLQDHHAPEDRIVSHPFALVRDRVVAREDHPLFAEGHANGEVSLQRLLDYSWVIYAADPVYRQVTLHATLERLGRAPTIRFDCESLIPVIGILQNTDCLCLLPVGAIADTANPRLLPLPVSLGHREVASGARFREEMADWPPLATLLQLCAERYPRSDSSIARV